MEPVFPTPLLALVEEIQDHLPNHMTDCQGCGSSAGHLQPWVEDDSDLLCFTCRQLAHAAANPCRVGIVEGSA